jgi:hypothetical protein
VFSSSFGWWTFNLAVTFIWIAGSIATGNYFVAIGGFVYIALMMLIELPGASSEEGSGEEDEGGGLF